MPPVAVAMPTPPTMPSVCETATQPPTTPRSRTGTRSGTVAVSAANIALREACASDQASTIARIDWAVASRTSASAPSSAPTTTHGTRRPKREVVRSDRAPKSGFATTETADPTPVTTPNTNSLWPGETTCACWASSTWIGPKNPAHSPSPASVTDATQRFGTETSGSASAPTDRRAAGRWSPVGGDHVAVPARTSPWACAAGCRSRRAPGRSAWCSPRPTRSCRAATRRSSRARRRRRRSPCATARRCASR